MKKQIILFLCLLTSLAVFSKERPLIILSHDRPPFHFKNSAGDVVGICVDITNVIFKEMGIKHKIVDLKWARVWQSIVDGSGEAAFSASRQEARKPYLYYPNTDMWRSDFVFFVHKDNINIAPNGSFSEIKASQKKIALWKGASYNSQFWQNFPYKDGTTVYSPEKASDEFYNDQFYIISSPDQAFKMVAKKRITFTLEDRVTGLRLIKENKLDNLVVPYKEPVFSKGYPMPFIKNSDYPRLKQIAQEFEQRLIAMIHDGRYQKILDRWL